MRTEFSDRLLGCIVLLLQCFWVCLWALPLTAQQGPTLESCPTSTALKLDAVVGYVTNKVADSRIADLIAVCHVGFAMDAVAIERLSTAGASRTVFEALDRDTFLRLSLVQARAEVAALEKRTQSNESPINAERDATLGKLDAEYGVQRKKIEEDPFRTSAQKASDVAALDRSHEADRIRISSRSAADLGRKNEPLERRITVLKRSLYPSQGAQPKYLGYVADDARLSAMIGGEEFWFTVAPDRARVMNEQWSAVKVLQRYEDQDSRERFLREAERAEPVAGRSRQIIEIETLLTSARQYLSSQRYDLSRDAYAKVLTLDPNNQEAKNGSELSIAGIEKKAKDDVAAAAETARLAQLRENLRRNPVPGTWFDPSTNLLWTDRDNGRNIAWRAANERCQALSLGNFSDWRLPSISELRTLYDPSNTKYTRQSNRATPSLPYHVKGDITLSAPFSWSSNTVTGRPLLHLTLLFTNGSQGQYDDVSGADGRTLCVRRFDAPEPPADVVSTQLGPTPTPSDKPPAIRVGQLICPGAVLGDVDVLTRENLRAPDREISAPTMIAEVDPQGIGIFKVVGSEKVYYMKSGPPPQASCESGGADAATSRIRVGGKVQAANLLKRISPVYSPAAQAARVQGVVSFEAVLAKDGTVQSIRLLAGHPLLVDAASAAVKQWVYKPTLLNGVAVEVITQIDINFTLSH